MTTDSVTEQAVLTHTHTHREMCFLESLAIIYYSEFSPWPCLKNSPELSRLLLIFTYLYLLMIHKVLNIVVSQRGHESRRIWGGFHFPLRVHELFALVVNLS